MSPLDLVSRAAQQARDLGHPWIGSEHLLLALLDTDSASGQALRACGLSYEAACEAVSGLSDSYVQRTPRRDDPYPSTPPRNWLVAPDIQRVDARAEGLAAGMGSPEATDEHELLALVWDPASTVALHLMERLGATRERVLQELGRLGVEVPMVPLPYRPLWGPTFRLSREEFEQLAAELRQRGILYRFNWKEGEAVVSIDEKGEGRDLRPPGVG
jgi:Clp amino terminal domain, pathogenicity island component